jgi:hypothetical protein
VSERYRQRVSRDLWVVLDDNGEIALETANGSTVVDAPSKLIDEMNDALTAAIAQRELLPGRPAVRALADAQLVDDVCRHVEQQPWGRDGNSPVPVEIWYHTRSGSGQQSYWAVRFVVAVKGATRKYGRTTGATLREALTAARAQQIGGAS